MRRDAVTTTLGDETRAEAPATLGARLRAQVRRRERPRAPIVLSRAAAVYLFAVGATMVALAALAFSRFDAGAYDWKIFAAVAVAAALSQLFVVRTPRNQSYQTAIVFITTAALLLPPELIVLVPLVQHVPEWIRERYRWPVPTFNIFNYTLNALAAWGVAHVVAGGDPAPTLRWALAGLGAAAAFIALNHVLLATMIRLAHGHSFRASKLFGFGTLSADLALALFGMSIASLISWNAWLVPAALAPLVLIHRALAVPALEEQARVDHKTGLYNARHFREALDDELARAKRFQRSMSLLVADLDLLRDINNTYGHLAGDMVLEGIGEIFRANLRDYDIASRFGGEEFAIVLPETSTDEANAIAERIRRALASTQFLLENGQEAIRATISIGVAGFPRDGSQSRELILRADEALYRAKLEGRNRVVDAGGPESEAAETARLKLAADKQTLAAAGRTETRAVS